MKNTLIIFHGLPATGKTTLGKRVAEEMNTPFFSRDAFKEELFEILGEHDGTTAWSRKLGKASYSLLYLTIEQLLVSGTPCVAETNWIPEYAEAKLTEISKRTNTKIIQVFCFTEEITRKERFKHRSETERHPAHMDAKRLNEGTGDDTLAHDAKNAPLKIACELIEVDTTDFSKVELQEIVKWIRSHME